MGVDFLTCSQCSETFPDCGPHQYCDRGHSLCPNCMGPQGDGAEIPVDECPVCLAGGTLLEQSRKRAAEDHATIAALTAERDAHLAACVDVQHLHLTALAERDAAVARADLAMKGAEQEMRNSRHFVERGNQLHAENLSLRAALTNIASTDPEQVSKERMVDGTMRTCVGWTVHDIADAALSAAPAATYPPIAQAMREIREAIGDGFTMAAPAATGTEAFWWCPECKAQVDGSAVTYEEHHEACGQRVAAKEAPSPAPHAEAVCKRVRDAIGSVDVEEADSDNLAVALCTYFSDHLDRPESDYAAEEENDETGWGPWVVERCEAALTRITEAALGAAGRTHG